MAHKRLTILSTYPPEDCGIAAYSSYLVDALRQNGPLTDITVVAPRWRHVSATHPRDALEYDHEAADYVPLILDAVAVTRPDVVGIQHEYGIFGVDDRFLRLLHGLRGRGCRVIVTMHSVHTSTSVDVGCGWARGVSLEGVAIEAYQRDLCGMADIVIVHHGTSMKNVLVRQGIDPQKVVVIPHGTLRIGHRGPLGAVADSLGNRSTDRLNRHLFLAPGYLRPSKNIETLLDAFAGLVDIVPEATLWIGCFSRDTSADARQYVVERRKQATRLGVADRVVFAGAPLSESGMTELLGSAEMVFCLYDEDTRSVSGILHRAIGAGATVIASRIPKFQELADVCDELLVDPRRPSELIRLVTRLIRDEPFRDAIRQRLDSFAARTAWSTVASAYLEVVRGGDRVVIGGRSSYCEAQVAAAALPSPASA